MRRGTHARAHTLHMSVPVTLPCAGTGQMAKLYGGQVYDLFHREGWVCIFDSHAAFGKKTGAQVRCRVALTSTVAVSMGGWYGHCCCALGSVVRVPSLCPGQRDMFFRVGEGCVGTRHGTCFTERDGYTCLIHSLLCGERKGHRYLAFFVLQGLLHHDVCTRSAARFFVRCERGRGLLGRMFHPPDAVTYSKKRLRYGYNHKFVFLLV